MCGERPNVLEVWSQTVVCLKGCCWSCYPPIKVLREEGSEWLMEEELGRSSLAQVE